MQEITSLKEVQNIILDILRYFDSFCKENDITYMLAYGTLLGAVRHKGFIPWDDDVDVMLTRENYEKLILKAKECSHPYYRFGLPEIDPDYYAPLAKLFDSRTFLVQPYGYSHKTELGLYIDIFVIDKYPPHREDIAGFNKKAQFLRSNWSLSIRALTSRSTSLRNYLLRVPYSLLCKMFGMKFWRDYYIKFCSSYSNSPTSYEGIILFGFGPKRELFKSSMYKSLTSVEFEGMHLFGPADVDSYLTQVYGDYMTLPPVEERKYHHTKVWWK